MARVELDVIDVDEAADSLPEGVTMIVKKFIGPAGGNPNVELRGPYRELVSWMVMSGWSADEATDMIERVR